MGKTRIQVYADPLLKRRIELAAAKRDMPVTEYCLAAIVQRLAEDEVLEAEQVTIDIEHKQADQLIASLHDLHESILARRRGIPIDTDAILEKVRSEREAELLNSLR